VLVSIVSRNDLVIHGLSSMLGSCAEVRVLPGPHGDLGVVHPGAEVVVYDAIHHAIHHEGGQDADQLVRLAASRTPVLALVGDDVPQWWSHRQERTTTARIHWATSAERLASAIVSARDEAVVGACAPRDPVPFVPWPRRVGSQAKFGVLSMREAEVLALISAGLSNAEIAARLFISINSVKTYIRAAYRKIGVVRRSQAVIWAMQHGVTEQSSSGIVTHLGVAPATPGGVQWVDAVVPRGVR